MTDKNSNKVTVVNRINRKRLANQLSGPFILYAMDKFMQSKRMRGEVPDEMFTVWAELRETLKVMLLDQGTKGSKSNNQKE